MNKENTSKLWKIIQEAGTDGLSALWLPKWMCWLLITTYFTKTARRSNEKSFEERYELD